jgi:hypothetical protein
MLQIAASTFVKPYMKPVAIGVRMHSGWGAFVAVAMTAGKVEVIDRRRMVVAPFGTPGAIQPYHFAKTLELHEAEAFLAKSLAVAENLARAELHDVVSELITREYLVVGCALLLASGRPLPALSKILSAHPLIHTAEGEFFRDAFRKASEGLQFSVAGFRERDLDKHFAETFGKSAARMSRQISDLSRAVGPPWTQDQKLATRAAMLVLAQR